MATGGILVYWKARESGVPADGAVEPDGAARKFLMLTGEDMVERYKEELDFCCTEDQSLRAHVIHGYNAN